MDENEMFVGHIRRDKLVFTSGVPLHILGALPRRRLHCVGLSMAVCVWQAPERRHSHRKEPPMSTRKCLQADKG